MEKEKSTISSSCLSRYVVMFISGAGDTKYGKEVHVHDLQQFSWKDPTEVIESNCLTIERLPKVKAYF